MMNSLSLGAQCASDKNAWQEVKSLAEAASGGVGLIG